MMWMGKVAGRVLHCAGLAGIIAAGPQAASADSAADASIAFLFAADGPARRALVGQDAALQLVVMRNVDGSHPSDVTRSVQYTASPGGLVEVSSDGWVTPRENGVATVRATSADGESASVEVEVTHQDAPLAINFANEVVPVFTKYGCNAGGCHGKSGGQNGFRLSLLGFEPQDDYAYLVKESRGRRIFPAAPCHSLLLRKATAQLPHGGGERFATDSPPYRLLSRWIEQGMPYGRDDDPVVSHIEVLPRERTLAQSETQQLAVLAHLSDGSVRDVSRAAHYESGDTELAEADERGLIQAGQSAGSVAVTVRYQTHVDVFRATVPLGAAVERLPIAQNFIDEHVFAKFQDLGLPPSDVCDDATFLRRATLDIAGRLPTPDEATAFGADADAAKRERLVERLVASTDYADYFANKWSTILRNRRDNENQKYATFAFHDWVRQSLLENKPYDQFVREILSAAGRVERNPAVAWYNEVQDQSSQVEDACQLFLGMRIQCARCHHHPAERWSQQDYYGLSAYFSRIGRKRSPTGGPDEHIFHEVGAASALHPRTGQPVPPTPLGGRPPDLSPQDDPRKALADWLAAPDNPFFAKALVNRYWKHFFGRGLVEPEDDMRLTNPATHPELLNRLAAEFVSSGYDLQALVRTICGSTSYALSSVPNEYNGLDKQSFSRFYPRRLPAEVLLDAIDDVTGAQSQFGGVPPDTRAVALPDNAFNSNFLRVFGRPNSASACECERSGDVNLAQCLHLLNSEDVRTKTAGPLSDQFAAAPEKDAEAVHGIYLTAYSREPTEQELLAAIGYLTEHRATADERDKAYEDLLWVIINTKEFLFNH